MNSAGTKAISSANGFPRLIKKKTGNSDATFADVQAQKDKKGFRDMYFMGTNLSTHFAEVFSFDRTPRICLADAVRISMSIPLFFASHRSPRGDIYVDGGVLDNYPVRLLTDSATWIPTIWRAMALKRITTPSTIESLKHKKLDISPYLFNKETLGFRLDTAREIAVFRDQAETGP